MNEKKKKKKTSLLIWDVPENLKTTFKATCAKRGVSMRDVILGFLKDFNHPVQVKGEKSLTDA